MPVDYFESKLRSLLPSRARLAAGFACWLTGLSLAPMAAAAEPRPAPNIAALIGQLDAPRFEIRQRAAASLAELSQEPAQQEPLAKAIHEVLLQPDTSFEVRSRLEPLLKKLPPTEPPVPLDISTEEIDRLIARLDAGKYAERLGAAARLKWLVTRPRIACEVMTRLKGFVADPKLSAEARKGLQPIWDASRQTWLTSDPKSWKLPPISAQEIDRWLDVLSLPAPPEDAAPAARKARALRQEQAQQELLDALVRDDYLPQTKAAIEARLATAELDMVARGRLEKLIEWTRPAMVAEYWEEKHHLGIQHLLIGEPSQSRGAERPSYFDRIDDRVAHCVSGNSLKPGDYPVGVLFPHPNALRANAQFHLVNLPTPRRRLAYEFSSKANETVRLAALSERTLAAIAAEKRPLGEAELAMLHELDAGAVSRFVGGYFLNVGDPVPPDRAEQNHMGRASGYANVCNLLVEIGTPDALPGLLAAIDAKKFAAPTAESPENWPWIAALSIAERDEGPKSDAWLAGLIERTDPLRIEGDSAPGAGPPELGATAAAILLARYKEPLNDFGLESAEDRMLAEFGAPGYRFVLPEGRRKVLRWQADRKPPIAQRSTAANSR
ncbi:MAG TPA: hypothetical protein VMV10_06580 [Pirellulales bacterium]|nr:hypothetical protein [Pirellulales bacterium]